MFIKGPCIYIPVDNVNELFRPKGTELFAFVNSFFVMLNQMVNNEI